MISQINSLYDNDIHIDDKHNQQVNYNHPFHVKELLVLTFALTIEYRMLLTFDISVDWHRQLFRLHLYNLNKRKN